MLSIAPEAFVEYNTLSILFDILVMGDELGYG